MKLNLFVAYDKKTKQVYDVIRIDFLNEKIYLGYFGNPYCGTKERNFNEVKIKINKNEKLNQ